MIGVMRLPSLAAALTAAGYTVITADDYKATATNIRAATDEHGPFPIFVADSKWPGLRAWATRFSNETTVVVVRTANGDGVDFADDSVIEARVPMSLPEFLALANRAVHPSFAAYKVDERGMVEGFAGDFDEQPPAPAPRPTAVEPQPEPAALTGPPAFVAPPVDDPWGDEPAAPPPSTEPQPTVVAPAAEPEATPSPAADPVFTTPAAGEPHPAEGVEALATPGTLDDPWDDAAAVDPVTVVPAVPDPLNDPWDDAAAADPVTVPAAEQASVFYAPSVEAQADPLADAWDETPAAPVFTAPPRRAPEHDPFEEEIVPTAPAGFEYAPPAQPVFTAPPVEQPVVDAPEAHDQAPVDDVYAALAAQQHAAAGPTNDPHIQDPSGELVPVSHSGHLATGDGATLGQVVISWAAKGGTGKTSTSVSLAQYAAEQGLRVILIDGNFGQGDIRTYLRIGMASLPSVYNYAITNDIKQTLISPPTLSEARDLKQAPLQFGLITAPPAHMTDESVVTPEVYMRLVADARAMADLVVIDTQIVESKDSSGMVDRFMMPLLASGAWGLCSADISSAGVTNTLTRLKKMAAHGVPRERQLSFLNRVPNNLTFHREGLVAAVSEHSVFLGFCYADTAIPETQNSGGLPIEVPQFAEFMGAALTNVFPHLALASQTQEDRGKPERKRRRLFGGRR